MVDDEIPDSDDEASDEEPEVLLTLKSASRNLKPRLEMEKEMLYKQADIQNISLR